MKVIINIFIIINMYVKMYVTVHMMLMIIVCSATGPLSSLLVSLLSFLLRPVHILSFPLVPILSSHFHHLHLQMRPANLKTFKLRLHFELENRHHLLLCSLYLKRGYPLLGTTHGALHLRPIPIPGNVTCPHQLRHPYLLLRNHTNTLLKRSRCSAYTIAAC